MAGAGAEGLVVLLWGPDSRVRLTVAWALLPIVLVLCEVLVVQAFLGMVTALEGLLLLLLLLWVIAEAAGLVGMKVWDPLARGQAGVGGQRPVVGLGGGGCAALVGVGPLPTGLATGGVGRGGGEGLGLLGEVAALGEGQGGGKVTLGFLPLELGVCQGWWGLRQLLLDVEGMSPEGQLGTLLWVSLCEQGVGRWTQSSAPTSVTVVTIYSFRAHMEVTLPPVQSVTAPKKSWPDGYT